MGDTETEKTRNPIPWICGLGAVWLSVGVARLWGSEDIGVISWLRWEREVEGNLCCRAPSFPTFQPTTPADESQIANSAGILSSHFVRCWLSHFFDNIWCLEPIFLKTFFYHILFFSLFFVIYWRKVYCLIIFRLHHVLDGRPRLEGGTLRGSDAEGWILNEYNYAKTLLKWQLFTSGGGAWEESKQSSWSKPAEAAAAWLPQPGAGEDQEEGKQGLLHLSPFEGSNIRKLVLNRCFCVGLGSGGCAWYMTHTALVLHPKSLGNPYAAIFLRFEAKF